MQDLIDFNPLGHWVHCPSRDGKVHNYAFPLYALDVGPPLEPGIPKRAQLQATSSHTLAQALVGVYNKDER